MTKVLVSSTPNTAMQHQVKGAKHTIIADAGKEVGGDESGLNPHELLLGSLGACTAMTLKVFASKRGWKLDAVDVQLEEEMIEDPNNPGKKMAKINREISVKGDLNQDQLDSLKTIADKCPIHKILVESKKIETNLAALN